MIEESTMCRFARIDLLNDWIPDETTILAFRHLLENLNLGEQIFETVKDHLRARWASPDYVDSSQGPAGVSVRVAINCCS